MESEAAATKSSKGGNQEQPSAKIISSCREHLGEKMKWLCAGFGLLAMEAGAFNVMVQTRGRQLASPTAAAALHEGLTQQRRDTSRTVSGASRGRYALHLSTASWSGPAHDADVPNIQCVVTWRTLFASLTQRRDKASSKMTVQTSHQLSKNRNSITHPDWLSSTTRGPLLLSLWSRRINNVLQNNFAIQYRTLYGTCVPGARIRVLHVDLPRLTFRI